jgi:hypothetical protein
MASETVVMHSRQCGKTAALELRDLTKEAPPPSRLSIDPNSEDFHPCYRRVGVRVDGVERNDLQWYDVKRKEYMTVNRTSHLADSIEPYWRYLPSRQQRRTEERWERKRK